MDQKKIGMFLKDLRREKGLTQEQLAEKFGVTNRSISRWENGINMPDFDLVIEIAVYFEISIEEFLDGERKTIATDFISEKDRKLKMPETENQTERSDHMNEEQLKNQKNKMTENQAEETLLKVADYTNNDKLVFSRRLHLLFIAAALAFILYMILDIMGLNDIGVYANIADCALGLVFGMVLVGAIFTSRYSSRIQAFKKRLLRRQ